MDDLISRADAQKASCEFLVEYCGGAFDENLQRKMSDRIKAVPSAQRTGHWVHLGGDEWCCSACGEIEHTEGSWEHPLKDLEWKYCHTCGARMVEE